MIAVHQQQAILSQIHSPWKQNTVNNKDNAQEIYPYISTSSDFWLAALRFSDNTCCSTNTFAIQVFYKVGDFSPPESPVCQHHGGPEPDQFESLVQTDGAETVGRKQLGLRTQSEWRSLVDDAARRIIILQLLVQQYKFTFSNMSWHATFFIFCLQMLLLWFDVRAFTGGGWEERLGEDRSCKRIHHLLSDQLMETLSCNSQVSNRRGWLLCILHICKCKKKIGVGGLVAL